MAPKRKGKGRTSGEPPPGGGPKQPDLGGSAQLLGESAGQLAYLKKAMSFIAWGQAKYAAARRPDGASSGD